MDDHGINGLSKDETVGPQQEARGEAGLGHLREGLKGYVLRDAEAAREFVNELGYLLGHKAPEMITMQVRPNPRLRGRYYPNAQHIELYVNFLATLVHEYAHHMTLRQFHARQCKLSEVSGHGRAFKRNFVTAMKAAYRIVGEEFPGGRRAVQADSSWMPPVGTEAAFLHPKRGVLGGTVVKHGRTRLQVRDQDGVTWTVPKNLLR